MDHSEAYSYYTLGLGIYTVSSPKRNILLKLEWTISPRQTNGHGGHGSHPYTPQSALYTPVFSQASQQMPYTVKAIP